ncbi:MAG: hypothetical protein MJZ76_10140 [Bacteroidales bacterium]|nr:hypothetical protein [Bacteroidales bacterium]
MSPYLHKVKYYECDPMGITHHSKYVRFTKDVQKKVTKKVAKRKFYSIFAA